MRTVFTILTISLFAFSFAGCQKEECKTCTEVYYEGGQKKREGDSSQYCGEELEEKESSSTTVGNQTKEYECS